MKVLLTGATGLVGSHVLDQLCARGIPTAVLVRKTSNLQFIKPHLDKIDVRQGTITEPDTLHAALDGVTHVIHCAGLTKALRVSDFYRVNHIGTRNVVEAVNRRAGQVQRLLHVSSLAAARPVRPGERLREDDPPQPVSHYGKSKLAGDLEVKQNCRVEFVIVQPPPVYGPRDEGFLPLFQTIKRHIRPVLFCGIRELSLVFATDLAEAIVNCLLHPAAAGKTYFVANPEVVPAHRFAKQIARHLNTWTVPLPLPVPLLLPLFGLLEAVALLSGRATIMTRQKYAELRPSAWVCDTTKAATELGIRCPTTLDKGLPLTVEWYRQHGWI
ncbi:MAG: NAD-dependent epimerase/dehydratase family protein [Verrucomicrobiae bacterium]|nr:NAD-dependent epimerase/dehydratase family protein [Verrucomicrobiae bacterium]